MRWQAAHLGEVADVNWGDTSVTKAAYVAAGHTAYSASGPDGYLPYADFDRTGVVLSAIGARCGKTWFAHGKWSCIKNTIRFWSTSPRLDDRYLYWATANGDFFPKRGAAQPFITIGDARATEILLPPLDEQRRIAAILDKADALRQKRKRAIALLDGVTQSIFVEMFGRQKADDTPFGSAALSEVAECLDSRRRPIKEADRVHGSVPYYGANAQQGWINRSLFNEDLVLVAEDGGHFESPERGVAYKISGPAWVNNHAHILRPRGGLVTVGYLYAALRHYDFRPYINGTTRSKLTQAQLNRVEITIPPISLQAEFDSRAAEVGRLCENLTSSLSVADALFTSLQHQGFSGEL